MSDCCGCPCPCPCLNQCCNGIPQTCCVCIQPPPARSFKPTIKLIPPNIPMERCTVYRKSYPPIDGRSILRCRPRMMRPNDNLQTSQNCKPSLQKETVASLSYRGYGCIPKTKPILPVSSLPLKETCFEQKNTDTDCNGACWYEPDCEAIPCCCTMGYQC